MDIPCPHNLLFIDEETCSVWNPPGQECPSGVAEISEDQRIMGLGCGCLGLTSGTHGAGRFFFFFCHNITLYSFKKNTKHLDVKILHPQHLRNRLETMHQLFTV